jgi:hypothetical protein
MRKGLPLGVAFLPITFFSVKNFRVAQGFPYPLFSCAMQRMGDMPELKRIVKRLAGPKPGQLKLVESAAKIAANRPHKGRRSVHGASVDPIHLPHSNPGNVPAWTRRNGSFTPARLDHKLNRSVGYPYGSIPRLGLVLDHN